MKAPTMTWGLALAGASLVGPPAGSAQTFDSIAAVVERGIERGVYPGAVVVVGRSDRVLYARGFGHFTWDPQSPVPSPDTTLWDIASMSKVVGTTTAIMLLVERGQLALDAPVSGYLPAFDSAGKGQVTLRMLLDHTSGLPSYRPFFKKAKDRTEALALLFAVGLEREPNQRPVYSDLNALLLGLVIEAVTGEPLDRFVEREVFAKLNMTRTRYRPARDDRPIVVPTGVWRGHPVGGEVNDQNAVVFGGAAGHAGVFSTGMDLVRYAQMWLNHGRTAQGRFLEAQTLERFLKPRAAAGSRLLGWDTPDPTPGQPSVFGALLSNRAYGHTGWTGTEFWIDPGRDLFLIFLTNRSFDPKVRRSIRVLRHIRSDLSDLVVRAVPGACDSAEPRC